MRARVASAAVGLPLVLLAVYAGSPWLAVLAGLAGLWALWELHRILLRPLDVPLLVLSWAWMAGLLANGELEGSHTLVAVTAGLMATLAWVLLRSRREAAIPALTAGVVGPLYVGLPLSFALMLRAQDQGWEWLLLGLLTTFAIDSAAFFTGRAVGKRPLAPTISPGKTWEGGIAGLVAGAAATAALDALLSLPLDLWEAVLAGLAFGVVAQAGDLVESALKRAAAVKEAGWLIPGHGGILDRMDSVVFVLAPLYYLATWVD